MMRLRQIGEVLAPQCAGHDDLEFVAAKPPDAADLVDRALKPLGHLGQQRIAGRMAHGIVDLLEAVEIEQEHGAGALFDALGIEDLFQRLRHLEAVGQAGQRIVVRQPRGIFLRAALFGEIGARSAKAEEIVETVVRRPARNRPPALLLARRCRAHGQFMERGARGKVEVQRALAFAVAVVEDEQVGKRPADKLCRLAAQAGGRSAAKDRTARRAGRFPRTSQGRSAHTPPAAVLRAPARVQVRVAGHRIRGRACPEGRRPICPFRSRRAKRSVPLSEWASRHEFRSTRQYAPPPSTADGWST